MKCMAVLLAILMCVPIVSCTEEDDEKLPTEKPGDMSDYEDLWEWVDPKTGVSDSLLNEYSNSVIMLSYLFTICPEEYGPDDAASYWDAIETLANYVEKNNIQTRGIFSQGVCYIKFVDALKSAGTTHRSMLMGVISKLGYANEKDLTSMFKEIKSQLYYSTSIQEYSAMDFWRDFSLGKLDNKVTLNKDIDAISIYHAVLSAGRLQSFDTPAQRVAEYLDYNNLSEINMTLSIAPSLIEAGVNLALGSSHDLIQNGKLAFDIVEANGKLGIDFVKGNLNAKTLSNAAATNLKLMSKALEEILPNSQDLLECVVDATVEQVQAFNEEVYSIINDCPQALSPEALELFKMNVEQILLSRHNLDKSVWYKDSLCILFGTHWDGAIPHRAILYTVPEGKTWRDSGAEYVASMDYVEFENYLDLKNICIWSPRFKKMGKSSDQTLSFFLDNYKTLRIMGTLGTGDRAYDLTGTWSIYREAETEKKYTIPDLWFRTFYSWIDLNGDIHHLADGIGEVAAYQVIVNDLTVTTKNQTTLHVDGRASSEYKSESEGYNDGYNRTVSFDIEGVDIKKNSFENCKLTNIKVTEEFEQDNSMYIDIKGVFSMSLNQLPLKSSSKHEVDGTKYIKFEFNGDVASGIGINDFVYNWKNDKWRMEQKYYNDDLNNATIEFSIILPD